MGIRNLLVNVGLAAAKAGAKFDPSGVASNLLDRYDKQREKDQLRGELEELLRAQFGSYREEVAGAMADQRLQLAGDVRAQVQAYLQQFQASAKQAARILGDASAKTVPNTVGVDDAVQLASFLPQRPPRFAVGAAVPGLPSWILTEPLGCGGFGEVWKAENQFFGPAAFKFFLDPSARKRFTVAEAGALAEILKRAPTDGVVKLLGAEPGQDPPWLQFEFVEGGDLSSLPESWKSLPDAERVTRVQGAIRTLAATAGHFHKLGVVHRDLKPSNVLVRQNGALVIADFGISKIVPDGLALPTPSNSGTATIRAYTALYASPEQKRFKPADRRDDVYALGVLWYQLLRGDLTLERPGGEGWKRALTKLGVGDAVVALLNRCWDDEPDDRPADGNELAALLDAAIAPRIAAVPVQANPERERRGETQHPITHAPGSLPAESNILINDVIRMQRPRPAERRPGEEVHFSLPGGLKMTFCWIPPGTSQLGSPLGVANHPDELEAKRGIYTTSGFWLAKYPVTQSEWFALTHSNPSHFQSGGGLTRNFLGQNTGNEKVKGLDTSRFPVEQVCWDDIVTTFLPKLNALSGIETVFGTAGAFSLPHEDQWEYACRGGTSNQQAFYWGQELNGTQANCDGTSPYATTQQGPSLGRTTTVGSYASMFPHPWGLCDMHGNVWEHCDTVYNQENHRVIRGGSWHGAGYVCRAGYRRGIAPNFRRLDFGLRLLLASVQ